MREIIRDNNLDRRVDVEYADEIGRMAQTFNMMLAELGRAYGQIKNFALQSVLAQKTEQKIRNIFQKYVPADVIDEVLGNPEAMLVGKNRDLAVLFSDIRGFTTISESMAPDELVLTLNRYFSLMVDVIMSRGGTVDKYIGDAVMAIFGAPVHSENDALSSVIAGLEMAGALDAFNADQIARGKKEFHIGIGINFGEVTVGNMGSVKKMNYTVIGDGVNLASRLEGLTKKYKQILLFSESVYQKVGRHVWCRLLDKVVVKGKTLGECIYTAQKSLTDAEKVGWATWHSALELYYARDFLAARSLFREVADRWIPGDAMALEFVERCDTWIQSPPPAGWVGLEVMHEK
jgi:class 3 adenylate cyclase